MFTVYGPGEILVAVVGGVGTVIGGPMFALAFIVAVATVGMGRLLDGYGVRGGH